MPRSIRFNLEKMQGHSKMPDDVQSEFSAIFAYNNFSNYKSSPNTEVQKS